MSNKSNLSKFKTLLWINLFVLFLTACQLKNIISNSDENTIESDTNSSPKLEEKVIAPFNEITGKITNLYVKGSLNDYIGDLDKKYLALAVRKAADTNQSQSFTNQGSGIKGSVKVIQSRTLSTQEIGKKDGFRECKTIRQTIILKDKREITESIVLCKGPDGWS